MLRRIFQAWLTGIRFWNPPHFSKTEFLIVWAVVGVGGFLLLPKFLHLADWLKLVVLVVFVLLAGFINYGLWRLSED